MDERAWLISAYARAPEVLRHALAALPPGRLDVRSAPGKWSPREIALHLCDAELASVFRLKRTIAEPGGTVPAFDQDRWTEALARVEDLEPALAAFAALRAEMAGVLRRLPADAWERTAVHPETGAHTLEDWLRGIVRHAENHIGQIRAQGAGGTG
jgi:hypothetical protein